MGTVIYLLAFLGHRLHFLHLAGHAAGHVRRMGSANCRWQRIRPKAWDKLAVRPTSQDAGLDAGQQYLLWPQRSGQVTEHIFGGDNRAAAHFVEGDVAKHQWHQAASQRQLHRRGLGPRRLRLHRRHRSGRRNT